MYEPTTALSLHRLSRQSLQKRYESDEEDVSESDAGGHDFIPPLTGSQRAGTFDSDISADENSHDDPDSDREEQLLAPYRGAKRQRPVSMDTVKRNSDVSFVEDAYVFDPEEDLVLELPSPDSPAPLASSLFLQPTIYVSPNTPPTTTNVRSRSSSPSSIFSVENAEIQIAKKITMMEPPARPTLVFINSLGSRSKNSRSRLNRSRTRGNPRDRESRIFDGRFENGLEVPRLTEIKTSSNDTENSESSSDESTCTTPAMPITDDDTPRPLQSATINRVSEIPVVPFLPPSPRIRPQSMYRPRPRTSGAEKSFPAMPNARPRRPTEPGRRPASIRSNSNSSVPSFASRPASPFPSDLGYIPDHYSEAGSLLSRTCSPVSYASSPPPTHQPPTQSQPPKRGHTSSKHSVSNILSQRSPMMRRMTRKHSETSSIHSMSSLRSEMDAANSLTSAPPMPASGSQSQMPLTAMNYDSHLVRKTSQRRHARHNSAAPGGRKFMGLKLGKKSFTKA
ncbi:uncharacterized protein N7496_004343 [Penicillium cataractarum]|uniref:Uncharacterized protein n=1 Tax=Penicillium cataractarum TaxID=2100454 RepID=A0A9W9SPT3_9EURO|nr:uncharacterized protein N7496_004343 [Penicillium cataractarum]KAJ5381915.1 hypothetical protein N7496_004343 [Penicillium cataractarum]